MSFREIWNGPSFLERGDAAYRMRAREKTPVKKQRKKRNILPTNTSIKIGIRICGINIKEKIMACKNDDCLAKDYCSCDPCESGWGKNDTYLHGRQCGCTEYTDPPAAIDSENR